MTEGCLICDQVAAVETLPGGPLADDGRVVAYHLPPIERFPQQYLGRVLLVTRRHVDRLGELAEDEAVAVGATARRTRARWRRSMTCCASISR